MASRANLTPDVAIGAAAATFALSSLLVCDSLIPDSCTSLVQELDEYGVQILRAAFGDGDEYTAARCRAELREDELLASVEQAGIGTKEEPC